MSKKVSVSRYCKSSKDRELFEKIANVIDLYGANEGSLIQILHASQQIFGFLPEEVQRFIADSLEMPQSYISGVVSFYSFFSTQPRGEHTIRTCLGTACYVRGGKAIVEHIQKALDVDVGGTTADGKFTFEIARCIGACGLAPAVMIDDVVYKQMTPAKLDALLAKF